MAFNRDEVSRLLVACHRRCCICHRFCGVKIETDHIESSADSGSDDIENAIPVCFECHAEIHSYNVRHPRGRKFQPDELRAHKKQWLEICSARPDIFMRATRDQDVGPLQALIDELEFNECIESSGERQGCKFRDQQFSRAVHEGSISILHDDLRKLILDAYQVMGAANSAIESVWLHRKNSTPWDLAAKAATSRIELAQHVARSAREKLLEFLGSESNI